MALEESPFNTKYEGFFQKDSEDFRNKMEVYERDKRPIYSLSSFPVLERRGESGKEKGSRSSSQLVKEDRPSVSQAFDRGHRTKPKDKNTKKTLEEELEQNNPELFNSLQDVKRTLQGHSMKRFQQFESLGMMNHEENSVRATAALRVDLLRRTVGRGVKAELEDNKSNKNEETSLELQLEAVLKVKDLQDLQALSLLKGSSETEYEKHRKVKRAMQSRTLEIQREAEAVSKALFRALEKYRGLIKETLQEPQKRRLPARSRGRSTAIELLEEVVTFSPVTLSSKEQQEVLLHSANDNMDRANGILERLKLYTQTVADDDAAPDKKAEHSSDGAKKQLDGEDTSSLEQIEAESSEKGKEVLLQPQQSRGANTKSEETKASGQQKARHKLMRKVSTSTLNAKADKEYEEELARAREAAKRKEDEKKFQLAFVLEPIENEADKDPPDLLQERFERIWDILAMPLMDKMEMVIRYTGEEGLEELLPALDQYEKCAGGVRLYKFLSSSPDSSTSDILLYNDLNIQPEYLDRCVQYIKDQASTLMELTGDTLTLNGKPLSHTF